MSDADAVHDQPAAAADAVHDQPAVTADADPGERTTVLDLDAIERDLADVEVALARLDSGDYWRDEVTGAELDEALLAEQPTARRSGAASGE